MVSILILESKGVKFAPNHFIAQTSLSNLLFPALTDITLTQAPLNAPFVQKIFLVKKAQEQIGR
jgi:hypothetical protein